MFKKNKNVFTEIFAIILLLSSLVPLHSEAWAGVQILESFSESQENFLAPKSLVKSESNKQIHLKGITRRNLVFGMFAVTSYPVYVLGLTVKESLLLVQSDDEIMKANAKLLGVSLQNPKRLTLGSELLGSFLDSSTKKILASMLPDSQIEARLVKDGKLTYDGLKVLGAYRYLNIKGNTPKNLLPSILAQSLNTQEVLRIEMWAWHFKQKPEGSIANDDEMEGIEKLRFENPPSSKESAYDYFSEKWEGSMYWNRMKDLNTFEEFMIQRIGMKWDAFIRVFDDLFELTWSETLKNKIPVHQMNYLRDHLLFMSVYHAFHLSAEDEKLDDATDFPGRELLGAQSGASLGFFQGYEGTTAAILAKNRRVVDWLSIQSDPSLSQLANEVKTIRNSDSSPEKKIEGLLRRWPASSNLSRFWVLSLLGQMEIRAGTFIDTSNDLRNVGIDDGNQVLNLALMRDKGKISGKGAEICYKIPEILKSLERGKYIRGPILYWHALLPVFNALKNASKFKSPFTLNPFFETAGSFNSPQLPAPSSVGKAA